MVLNHFYLCVSSSLLVTSLFYFMLCSSHSIMECFLAFLVVCVLITSQLFWYNPIRYSLLHKIDAIIAKSTILCFFIYTFFIKSQDDIRFFGYFALFVVLLFFATLSDHYSQQEWLSTSHIVFHGLLHIVSFMGTFFAFCP
jgi:hypothetical protein